VQKVDDKKAVLFDEFCQAISEKLGIEEHLLQPSSLWVKDIGITSVDIVKITLLIRQKFGVKVSTTQAGRIKTVKDAYELLRLGGKHG
jgi:acyl carrier protein